MIAWEIKNLTEGEIPSCDTPQKIIDYTFTIMQKVLPDTSLDQIAAIFEKEKKNMYQIAYYWVKLTSEVFDDLEKEDIKAECTVKNIKLQRKNPASLKALDEIRRKYNAKYYSYELMHLKLQAETLMVKDMFKTIDSKNLYTSPEDKEMYKDIKIHWNHTATRSKVIELAYNFTSN